MNHIHLVSINSWHSYDVGLGVAGFQPPAIIFLRKTAADVLAVVVAPPPDRIWGAEAR